MSMVIVEESTGFETEKGIYVQAEKVKKMQKLGCEIISIETTGKHSVYLLGYKL